MFLLIICIVLIIIICIYCLNNKIVEGYDQTQNCIGTYDEYYEPCSKTCGGGTQKLAFNVDIDPVSGYFRGNQKEPVPCPLDLTRECNTHNCPIDCKYDGGGEGWSNWNKNLDSNEKQIGTETRTRQIRIKDKYGGKSCDNLTETRKHNVNCVQSAWSNWGACSKTCGGGEQRRTRSILQHPKNSGNKCEASEQTQSCNTQPCPIDCVGSWSDTTNCDPSTGKIIKKYTISQHAQHGGTPCGYGDGATMKGHTNCNVDCNVSAWGGYSDCSKSCGTGVQYRSRKIVRNKKNNGAKCPILEESKNCNTHACKRKRTHCCTASLNRGDMSDAEVKQLRDWHFNQSKIWIIGYDVWGKIIADNLVSKSKWQSDRVRDFYYHKINGTRTLGSVYADIVIYPISYLIGAYKILLDNSNSL